VEAVLNCPDMRILLLGTFIFFLALSLHLAIWRLCLPKRHRKALLRIFLATFFVIIFVIWILSSRDLIPGIFRIHYFSEVIHTFIFVIAFTFSYIITYSAVEANSPSLAIIKTIARAGDEGLGKEKLLMMLNNDVLIRPRLADLLTDGLVSITDGRYRLTSKGFLTARIFITYRKLLNLPIGG
jgi:hypothetical protein